MMKWWMLIVMMWVVTAMPVKVNAQGALAGDANGDCKVDGVDFVVVFNNYGKPTSGIMDRCARVPPCRHRHRHQLQPQEVRLRHCHRLSPDRGYGLRLRS
ncbi:MAG: hypothetical protein UX52_C0009G0012 [Candidatus Amesbacteria bacterium GW2011_GWA1_46_35]|nr:MAG: hypothetical protein UX52_C0009G0012 [Candidatus Amesbacteria bacterium GW2011_GWA1_46_35]